MEVSPFSFTPERYWTEEKERALIAFFSSKWQSPWQTLFTPRVKTFLKVALFVDVSEAATFAGNGCWTRPTAVSNERQQRETSNGDRQLKSS